MNVLITGLNSLIGWHCFRQVRDRVSVLGTYRRAHRSLRTEESVRLDLDCRSEIRRILRRFRPTHIIHARAICDLDVCEALPDLTERINVASTEMLLEEAESAGSVRRFGYVSTDHVFDGERGWYGETDIPNPKHVYGRSKVRAEAAVAASRLSWVIVRPGLAIGESVQGNKGPRGWLFSRLRAGKISHLFRDEWRTPVGVDTLAGTLLELVCSNREGIFHVAGPVRINRYELALRLAEREHFPIEGIRSRFRAEDRWAAIRPRDITLRSTKLMPCEFRI